MFEPAHGSAPKYAGQDKVNPVATVLAGAWMLDYLGEKEKSEAIFRAAEHVISEGRYVTYDLGGSAKLSQMADEIARQTEKNPEITILEINNLKIQIRRSKISGKSC